jgi:TfoX/Sxy family transcriptional regulator of competence genes
LQVEVTDIDDDDVRLSDFLDEATIRSLFAGQRLLEQESISKSVKLERHSMRMHTVVVQTALDEACRSRVPFYM